jgi:hypothetical protein
MASLAGFVQCRERASGSEHNHRADDHQQKGFHRNLDHASTPAPTSENLIAA